MPIDAVMNNISDLSHKPSYQGSQKRVRLKTLPPLPTQTHHEENMRWLCGRQAHTSFLLAIGGLLLTIELLGLQIFWSLPAVGALFPYNPFCQSFQALLLAVGKYLSVPKWTVSK